MNAGMKALLIENLKKLKLSTMLRELEGVIRQANQESLSYEEFLLNLSEAEVQTRQENGRKRRLQEAKFPILKPMETFDFDAAPGLDVRLMKELANCDYVKKSRNIIFAGKSGAGKTHLSTALGMEACKQGIRSRFVTGCGLANELIEARDEKQLGRAVKRYASYGLLIIDELGYIPFSKEGAQLIFQILAERHERKSVIITTNKGFGDWTEIFGDPSMTAALLDRVTHKAHIINCDWDSYRLKETLKRSPK
ncbi:IstB-like ATP-binding protein [delta proteobacterium NaphS2]|nr:IstB-like ATP-binding protein [delta proteobacterium NaphS2]EFK06409.1 IstB-like ATP-binding protein [delta proteobacterium NaphS2]EFK07077.1 IstB-like ATP-binding protein [delta proteobacterium NaphS2]EFK08801.1 IstB-like ATP-binding protein [delta proteobacterium NaphS2]EFK09091.1 IstB-like ATP-binding protein [delta proteobacterium NaphS2]